MQQVEQRCFLAGFVLPFKPSLTPQATHLESFSPWSHVCHVFCASGVAVV